MNIEAILAKHGVDHFSPEHAKLKGTPDWQLIQAFKEALETVVDMCEKEAKFIIKNGDKNASFDLYQKNDFIIRKDTDSILNVKKLINYG